MALSGMRTLVNRLPKLAVSALLFRHDWKGIIIGAALRVALVLYALSAHAQQIVVSQPDCIIFFHFTASGQTSPLAPNLGFSNLQNGCTTWNVSYANSGFSAITLAFQSAANNAGVAGSWGTFAGGTLLSGINPNTNTTGAFTWLTGYNPWVRVALTSATGSGNVDGAIFGYRIPSAGATGTGTQTVSGTVTANQGTAGAGAWPVSVASLPALPANQSVNVSQVGGSTASGCPLTAVVSVSAAATTQIVALSGSTNIKVCSIAISMTATGSAQFISGTGVDCASGPANLTGAIKLATGVPLSVAAPLGNSLLAAGASKALCIAAVTGDVLGFIGYSQN